MARVYFLRTVFFIIAVGSLQKGSAQTASISGQVIDSITNYTLSGVTVAAYLSKDSSLLEVQLTSNTGKFHLTSIPRAEELDLYISFTGFQPYHRRLYIDSGEIALQIDTIRLLRNYEQLEGIVIKLAPPISMNGDTLEINPAAFRMDKNAVVEDLLRKVEGVIIWGDGTISVNGRKVDHVFVDGRPFISESPRVATQNLPEDVIEKIQVYQGKGSDVTAGISDSLLSMNIVLKEDHQFGLLSKVSAGYGSSGKHDLALAGILFNRQSRLAVVGLANNINKRIAGIETALENNTYKNNNPNLADAPDFEMDGKNRSTFYGGVFQHNFKPKKRIFLANDLRAEFIHSESGTQLQSDLLQNSVINNSAEVIQSNTFSNNRRELSDAKISYGRKKANTGYYIAANLGSIKIRTGEDNHTLQNIDNKPVSENTSVNYGNSHARKAEIGGKYNYNDIIHLGLKNVLLNYELSYDDNIANRGTNNQFHSFVNTVQDQSRERKYYLENTKAKGNLFVSYPGLKRLMLGRRNGQDMEIILNNRLRISNEKSLQQVLDLDAVSQDFYKNSYLTYNDNFDSIQYKPTLLIQKSFGKYLSGRVDRTIRFGLSLQADFLSLNHSSSVVDRNLDRSFAFFEPELSVGYIHQNNKRKILLEYKSYVENNVPTLNQLFPVVDSINPFDIRIGNPLLTGERVYTNTFSAEYKQIKGNSPKNFNTVFHASHAYSKNAISDSLFYDESGRKIFFPANVSQGQNWSASLNVNYSMKLSENLLQVRYQGVINRTMMPGYINNDLNVSDYISVDHNLVVGYSLSSLVTIEALQNVSFRRFNLSGAIKRNDLYNTGCNINLYPVSRLLISSSVNYVKSSSAGSRSFLWNIYLTCRFLKNETCELKFSGFDIMKNYKNITTDVGYNFTSTTVNSGLQQFFMVSVSYFPRYY